jgi:predicted DNA-binding transcriptional regulator AlpA
MTESAARILDRDDLCALWKCSYTTVWRYLNAGLPHRRCGREVFFREDEINEWVRPTPGKPPKGGRHMASKKEVIAENESLRDMVAETNRLLKEILLLLLKQSVK